MCMTHEISDRGPAARVLAADAGDGADAARLYRVRQAPPGRMTFNDEALLSHFCCTSVKLLLQFWCASGALLVHFWCDVGMRHLCHGGLKVLACRVVGCEDVLAQKRKPQYALCVGAEKDTLACIMCWRRKGNLSMHHAMGRRRGLLILD